LCPVFVWYKSLIVSIICIIQIFDRIKDLYHTNIGYNQGFVPYKYWIQLKICTIQILDTIKDLYHTNTGHNQGFVL
jgi:hypothetical protein